MCVCESVFRVGATQAMMDGPGPYRKYTAYGSTPCVFTPFTGTSAKDHCTAQLLP